MIMIRAVNLMHLNVFFATFYKKMDLAKICFDLFVVQILNFILHFLHISWVRAYKFKF